MKYIILDIIIIAVNIWSAIVNRGTIWGWLSALVVLVLSYLMIKAIREV